MPPSPLVDRRLAIAVVAGVAGLLINLIPIPALAGLSLGRALTLPIAILFGPWHGLVAALISSAGYSAVVPARIGMFGVEAVVIGLFAMRA